MKDKRVESWEIWRVLERLTRARAVGYLGLHFDDVASVLHARRCCRHHKDVQLDPIDTTKHQVLAPSCAFVHHRVWWLSLIYGPFFYSLCYSFFFFLCQGICETRKVFCFRLEKFIKLQIPHQKNSNWRKFFQGRLPSGWKEWGRAISPCRTTCFPISTNTDDSFAWPTFLAASLTSLPNFWWFIHDNYFRTRWNWLGSDSQK